ncbi:unnamed protein product, partial [Didymodactylos carnosus]
VHIGEDVRHENDTEQYYAQKINLQHLTKFVF